MDNQPAVHAASAPTNDLGGRIRQVRTAQGMSVRGLAARAGCSPSLVSQVERGMTAPSARVVYELANELGITLDSLFSSEGAASAEPVSMAHNGADHPGSARNGAATPDTGSWGRATGPDGAGIVQRANDRRTIELSSGVRWERLTPTHDSKVDFLEVVYAPGGQSSDSGQAVRHDGREYLYVLHGELEAVIGFDTFRLLEGDSLAFDPTTPHHYRNPTTEIVRALSVVVHQHST
ncbi:helix-turn-helix domain-containing protein [Mycobacterium sp.]|uniref:helix-turn-helix domain-containing protein n=1 Tax=Mycobacterium sp. TaxID=1785 RepID=UPI003D0F5632